MSFDSNAGGVVWLRRIAMSSCLLLLGSLALLNAPSASAAPPELWTACPTGTGAGQCAFPRGIVADPGDGHIFITELANRRITELNARGEFIKAWGWGVDTGASELQICTAESSCQAALPSGGEGGRLGAPIGIALDSAGNVYVVDFFTRRVQKYDPSGAFQLTFGGEVNKTKVEEGTASEAEENLCPVDPGDECKAGVQGTGQGQFGAWAVGDFITVDGEGTASPADDIVYVGDQNRIQVFNTEGAYQDEISLPGKTVRSLDVDSAGNLYAIYNNEPDVRKINATGTELASPRFRITNPNGGVELPTAVAVDPAGSVYAFGPTTAVGAFVDPLFEFDAAGNELDNWGKGEFNGSTGLATNLCAGSEPPGNLYVSNSRNNPSFVRAYGTDPLGCFKARTLPASEITETSATLNGSVDPDGLAVSECRFEYGLTESFGQEAPCVPATPSGSDPVAVQAEISGLTKGTVYHVRLRAKVGAETETGADVPFKTTGPPVIADEWTERATATQARLKAVINPEGFATSYHFEYGAADCASNPCTSTADTAIGSERGDRSVAVTLSGLAPGTTYHWRVVAVNSSGTVASPDHILTTYRPFAPQTDCPNQALRSGAGALLPDCRAYEMVSPVDKNGANIRRGLSFLRPGGYVQSTAGGDKLTYTALASFVDEPNAFQHNQYLATRTEGAGWENHGIHPPVTEQPIEGDPIAFGLPRDFMAFTPDLCSAWVIDYQEPPPTADGQVGHRNLYRRDNCAPGAGGLEALIPDTTVLPGGTPHEYVTNDSVQGRSDDGSHALFLANAQLNPDAREGSTGNQLYDRFGNANHLVSVLPNSAVGDPAPGDGMGFAAPGPSAVGSGLSGTLQGAVTADGSRVFWTAGVSSVGRGTLYMREHPEHGIVAGECEGANACTRRVSGPLSEFGASAFFWAASSNGSKALYSEQNLSGGESLFVFHLGQPRRPIAASAEGAVGWSEDLSRVYFVSSEALAGAAVEGEPNLYLDEEGEKSFVATLAEDDVSSEPEEVNAQVAYDLDSPDFALRPARASADGSRIVFQSRAPLTDYDNTHMASDEAAVEVFSYEATSDQLVCVSCNPSGARPAAREMVRPYGTPGDPSQRTGVFAAAWIPTWEQPLHASNVLSADGGRLFFNSNDALLPRDANGAQDVYEWEAPGVGGCDEDDPSYFAKNGGCLYLISSGESPFESEFWEASPSGDDVFFTTASSLLPQDPGLIDLYDARVGGGFPQPVPEAPCEGEACQSPPPPPRFDTPASGAYRGPGNEPALKDCGAAGRRAAKLSRRAKAARRTARRANARTLSRRSRTRARRFARKARKLSNNAKRCRRANRRAQR